MDESHFSIAHSTTEYGETLGFKLTFPNHYTISVVFGGKTDSDELKFAQIGEKFEYFCKTAEVAVINPTGDLVPFGTNQTVRGQVKPEELPQIISWTMNR